MKINDMERLVNLRRFFLEKKWAVYTVIVLLVCIIRGLAYQFLWKTESFLEGAVYPFVIIAIGFAMIFPLYLMNKKYGNPDSEENIDSGLDSDPNLNSASKGCLLLPLQLLLVIAAVFFLFAGVPGLAEMLYITPSNKSIGNYVQTSSCTYLYFFMALYLLCVIYWLCSKRGIFGNAFQGSKGYVCTLPKSWRIKVIIGTLLCYLLSLGLLLTCYDQIDDTGFLQKRVISEKHYDYEDVAYYQLYAAHDGTLRYRIHFLDGNKMDYYGDCVMYSIDETKYPNEADDYVVAISKRLTRAGCKCKVRNKEKLYNDLTYDYWDEVAQKIIDVSVVEEDN